jgi:HYR domain
VFTTSGLCAGTATVTASATDLCNPLPIISYVLSGVTSGTGGSSVTQAFNRGPTIVTFTATDGTNTSTCQTVVTVTDNQPPTIACPSVAPVTTLPTATTCEASVTIGSLSPMDNCTIASTSFTKLFNTVTSGSVSSLNATGTYPVGATVVTFTTTDIAGLTGTCSFTVNVSDATNPTVTCPANIVTSTGINVCTKTVSFAPLSSNDNCAVVSTSWSASGASPASGTTASGMALFPGGTTPVTFTVRDAQNNLGQCTFNVIVNDNEAPFITAINDVTINSSLGITTDCAAPLSISATVTDNCLLTAVTWKATGATTIGTTPGASFTNQIFNVGTTTVTFTATDNSGNSSIKPFDVVVVDNQAPTFSNCPLTPPTANMDGGDCFTERTFSVTASDNCTTSASLVASWSVTNTAAALNSSGTGLAINAFNFPGGNNIVTFTVTDGATVPNTSTCQFTFTVQDYQPPVIAAIANVTINSSLAPTTDCAAPLSISASATDNCPIIAIIYSWTAPGATPASGTGNSATSVLFPVGTTTVTYTATDAAGNTDTEVFDVLVLDNQVPVVTCPTMPVALNTDNTNLSAPCTVSYSFTPTVVDNCTPTTAQSGPIVTYAWTVTNGGIIATGTSAMIASTVLPIGTNTVVFTATDAAGNTSSSTACTFTVVVTDDDPPVVTSCPPAVTMQLTTGTCVKSYTATPSVSDNCTAQLTYAWTVSNGSTLITTGTSAMITASLPKGVNTVAFTATDAANNTSQQCNIAVTIQDVQAPSVACTGNSVVNVDAASCTNAYTYTPAVTDNCAMLSMPTTYDWTVTNGVFTATGTANAISGALPVGVNTVSFTATDASGNTSTACTYTVTVVDNIAPTFTCPQSVNVTTDQGQCTSNQSFAIPAMDNCGGVVKYQWTVTLGQNTTSSGSNSTVAGLFPVGTSTVAFIAQDNVTPTPNTNLCTFSVTVRDNEAPTFTAPANKSVPTNFTGCTWRGVLGTPTLLTENCSGVTYAWSTTSSGITPTSGTVSTVVTITNGSNVIITWTASDAAMPTVNTTLPQTQTVSVLTTLALSGQILVVENSGIANNDGIVCAGSTVTLTASAIGGTPTYSYAWSPTSPAVSNGVAFTPTAATADYAVTVTDANGCTVNTSGNPKTVVVKPTPTVTVATIGSITTNRIQICENPGNLVLNFATTGMSGSSNSYTVTGATGGLASLFTPTPATGNFSGTATSISIPLAATSATGTAQVTLSFTSADGCAAISKTFFVNINAGATAQLAGTVFLGPNAVFPNISRELCDAATPLPVTVNFTGAAPFSLTYSNGTTTSTISTVGAATSLVIPGSATTPGVYTIVAVTDATGCAGSTTPNRSIAIVDRRITIGTQPQSVSVCEGTAVSFSVAATVVGAQTITYQWYHRPTSLASWVVVSGNASASTATLTIPAAQVLATATGTQYYCGLTNTASGCADVFTTPATLTVGAAITGVTAGTDATVGSSPYSLLGNIGTGTSGTWTVVPANALVIVTPASSPTATVSGLPVGATTLLWTVSNGACTVSDDVVLTRAGIIVNITAALEGPLNTVTGEMFTNIRSVIPADGNNYPSSTLRGVTGPLGIVDWITVELRTSPTTAATGIFVKQALIRSDGQIVEPVDGTSPLLFDVPDGNYYISVKHRNHLGFRSAVENLTASTTPYVFDFASGLYLAYGTATPGLKQISGVFCAYTGNINNTDNTVNALDYNIWQATRFQTGYKPADINLDGSVNSIDYNLWVLNRFKTAQY